MKAPAIAILVCAIGCGDGGASQGPGAPDAPPGDLDSVELAPFPGWPSSAGVRAVGSAFRTSVTKIDLDPQGRMWLLRSDYRDDSQFPGSPVLERYNPNGHLEKRVDLSDHALVPDFVIHPSGELSVFILEPDVEPDSYRLEIARVSGDGAIVSRTEFHDTAGPRENLYYDDTGVHTVSTDRPLRFNYRSHIVGLADGEGLYLLAWTYGAKLYRLGPDHAELWDAQVMPANLGMAFYFINEVLATDESGRIHVAYQIFDEDVHIFNDHFQRGTLQPIGSYDVLVERFDPDGTFSGAAVLGGPGGDAPTAMTARGGRVLVTGASRITKFDLPNRTREWDLFVLRGDLDHRQLLSYSALDLARDDFGWAMAEASDGTIYIAGRNDYVQVDTNSEVENGKGLLLALSPDLSRQATLSFAGPRDVQVSSMRLAPDGRLVFAGIRNGPLTHTDRAMFNNDGFLGATTLGPP